MKLIRHLGLNCYLSSVVTCAAFLGVNCVDAYATLWSESDFRYDAIHSVYLTKQLIANLEVLGVKNRPLSCTPPELEASFSLAREGQLFVVGMDAFHIPWSPIYKLLHDPHYFVAQKGSGESLICFDPTYEKQNMTIAHTDILPFVYDMKQIDKIKITPWQHTDKGEMQAVIKGHPPLEKQLLSKIHRCTGENQKDAAGLAKYTDAMINNRYLYKYYLDQQLQIPPGQLPVFEEAFFYRWKTVKNGLYKAAFIRGNERVIHDVAQLFRELMEEEVVLAEKMLSFL